MLSCGLGSCFPPLFFLRAYLVWLGTQSVRGCSIHPLSCLTWLPRRNSSQQPFSYRRSPVNSGQNQRIIRAADGGRPCATNGAVSQVPRTLRKISAVQTCYSSASSDTLRAFKKVSAPWVHAVAGTWGAGGTEPHDVLPKPDGHAKLPLRPKAANSPGPEPANPL
jgi:hypothetical protein